MASLKSRVSRKVLARCSEKESLKATMLAVGRGDEGRVLARVAAATLTPQ